MIYDIQDFLKRFFKSRLFVLSTVMVLMFSVILIRAFSLQIINGQMYQENFELRIEKTLAVDATRGNIYDVNGKLLAYNELAYSVTISDSGKYENQKEKNKILNPQLADVLQMLEDNGETITNSFKIDLNEDGTYSYNVSGTQLKRFLADVFGEASYSNLSYNEKFGFNEATATAEQVMTYLLSSFGIGEEYSQKIAYEITVIRYAMKSIVYSRYNAITVAEDVSDKTVAYINEHMDEMIGMEIRETTIRKYNESIYFASIIGYTGRISEAEYEKLSATDSSYSRDDVIGKSGLEQYYESYLRGSNGEQVVYVDTVGRISEIINYIEPVAGSDLYLSIDSDLQKAVYLLLEQEIAGIVYSNIKAGNIPIKDVYYALLDNNIIDVAGIDIATATATEQDVYNEFMKEQNNAIEDVKAQLYSSNPLIINRMSDEMLDYFTYVFSLLKDEGVLLSSRIDTNDSIYVQWRNGQMSPQEYLAYCISQQWIDISILDVDSKYADTTEIYNAVCNLIFEEAVKDKDFAKCVYKYMVEDNEITGKQVCILLFDQGVLDYDEESYTKLHSGRLRPYNFLLDKINYLEITPAQLALDPCTGSCVITDVNTGEVRALVSYPGYDNNMLANGVDAEYYAKLNDDNSNPQWNYATQEKTAPGSTFKMVTSVAGLAEGIITPSTLLECTGVFTLVDNEPKCWIYPGGTHSSENLIEALRDSCNVYYYDLGYQLSTKKTGVYNDANGISYIKEYASIFGLDKKTGLEIAESTSTVATNYPVMAAIGQSNNNYTTAALSRYVTAVATGKVYDYQLMNKIVDCKGNVLVEYTPQYEDISSILSDEHWTSIRYGMKLMSESDYALKNLPIATAGKTGTAQQVEDRPNHALFIGYAPYDNPEISIATRIAYGYASGNTSGVSKNILSYYYGYETLEQILALHASGVNSSTNNNFTD